MSKTTSLTLSAYRLAGGARIFSALPLEARRALRHRALELERLARKVESAARREASVVREGHVYIITSPLHPTRLKIGSAVNVESRLKDAQTWCPRRSFRVRHAIFSRDRNASERRIHRHLRAYRLQGEWFELPLSQAKAILDLEARQALPAEHRQNLNRKGTK